MNKIEQLLEKYKNKTRTTGKSKTPERPIKSRSNAAAGDNPAGAGPNEGSPGVSAQATMHGFPGFAVHYVTDPQKAQEIAETEFTADTVIGLDIETMKIPRFKHHSQAGLSPYLSGIRLVQLCQSPDIVYVFDIAKTGLDPIKSVFAKPLVSHNAVFEMAHFYHAGIEIPHIDCTLLMHNALHGGRISLKDLAWKLLGIDISKAEQTSNWGEPELSQDQINYAAMDAWLLQQTYQLLTYKLAEQQKQEIYGLLQAVQYPTMKMEYNGCHFDATAHYLLTERNKKALQEAEKRLKETVGPEVNPGSTKQLSDYFKRTLDEKTLRKWKRTEKSQDLCLDKNTVRQFGHIKAVAPLAEYNVLSTKVSNYGDSLRDKINPVTGRLHPSYKIAGAVTGRYSCSKPNLQSISNEKAYRSLFNAPLSRVIIVADYSQVELRILAMLAKDTAMLAIYAEGGDLHRARAAYIAGIPPEQVTSEQRRKSKPVNFGIPYGMGPRGLIESARNNYGITMTKKKAKEDIEAFYNQFPEVKKWVSRNYADADLYKYVETKLGRTIRIRNAYTESRNYPVQGSAGEVMLAALIELDKEITESGLDIKLVNTVHDEIVLEVALDHAEQARQLLEKAMINGMLRIFPEAETNGLVEAAIGNSWGEAK